MALDNVVVATDEPQEVEHDDDVAICSENISDDSRRRTFTTRSRAIAAAGGIVVVLGVLVVVTIVTTIVIAPKEKAATLQPAGMTEPQVLEYQGKCILIEREMRLVDSYREEAATFKNQSDSGCIISVAGQEVLHLVGQDCDTAATAQCVAYPHADWCAHEAYKPFCLPQKECSNPFDFDVSLLSEKISFEKCEDGVLTFTFNGTYSNDAPLIKYVDAGKVVIDASGTVKVINSAHFTADRQFSDDPSVVLGKDVTLVILGNVFCDDTKTTKYVCENLTEWQDELGTWRPWEYPCWIYPELGEGQIVTQVQVKELCGCMMVGG